MKLKQEIGLLKEKLNASINIFDQPTGSVITGDKIIIYLFIYTIFRIHFLNSLNIVFKFLFCSPVSRNGVFQI